MQSEDLDDKKTKLLGSTRTSHGNMCSRRSDHIHQNTHAGSRDVIEFFSC